MIPRLSLSIPTVERGVKAISRRFSHQSGRQGDVDEEKGERESVDRGGDEGKKRRKEENIPSVFIPWRKGRTKGKESGSIAKKGGVEKLTSIKKEQGKGCPVSGGRLYSEKRRRGSAKSHVPGKEKRDASLFSWRERKKKILREEKGRTAPRLS